MITNLDMVPKCIPGLHQEALHTAIRHIVQHRIPCTVPDDLGRRWCYRRSTPASHAKRSQLKSSVILFTRKGHKEDIAGQTEKNAIIELKLKKQSNEGNSSKNIFKQGN